MDEILSKNENGPPDFVFFTLFVTSLEDCCMKTKVMYRNDSKTKNENQDITSGNHSIEI